MPRITSSFTDTWNTTIPVDWQDHLTYIKGMQGQTREMTGTILIAPKVQEPHICGMPMIYLPEKEIGEQFLAPPEGTLAKCTCGRYYITEQRGYCYNSWCLISEKKALKYLKKVGQ
jgi:hypothetical protein